MQRVLLTWKEPADSHMEDLVTGVVVGLLGREKGKGEFEVEDVCYPRLPLQKKVPKPIATEDKYVMESMTVYHASLLRVYHAVVY